MNLEQVRNLRNETRKTQDTMKARQQIFGITFDKIESNLDLLIDLLNKHIACFNIKMANDKTKYWLNINKPRIERNYIYLTAKGKYFEEREAITFCDSGFIGFCSKADDKNEEPILTAFGEFLEKTSEIM